MAAVMSRPCLDPNAIPGLGLPLQKETLMASTALYNQLAHVDKRLDLGEKHALDIKGLVDIIQRHGMSSRFRLHSSHRHDNIPDGTARVEACMGSAGYKWTRAVPVSDTEPASLHATLFRVESGRLVPVEFAQGPSPLDGYPVPATFINDAVGYILENELTDKLLLEVVDTAAIRFKAAELEIHWGQQEAFTVVLPQSILVKDKVTFYPSSWSAAGVSDGEGDPSPGVVYAEAGVGTKKTHKVFVSRSTPACEASILAALQEKGIMAQA